MLSMISDDAFSHTNCARLMIAPTSTICILSVCLRCGWTRQEHSAPQCKSSYLVGITTLYSWASGHNIHCGVFWHLWEKVNIVFPAGRHSWHWRIWSGGVQRKNNTGKEGTGPWKVLSRSLSVYWTQMLSDSRISPWFALVYSMLESYPRCSTDVGQWNGSS